MRAIGNGTPTTAYCSFSCDSVERRHLRALEFFLESLQVLLGPTIWRFYRSFMTSWSRSYLHHWIVKLYWATCQKNSRRSSQVPKLSLIWHLSSWRARRMQHWEESFIQPTIISLRLEQSLVRYTDLCSFYHYCRAHVAPSYSYCRQWIVPVSLKTLWRDISRSSNHL